MREIRGQSDRSTRAGGGGLALFIHSLLLCVFLSAFILYSSFAARTVSCSRSDACGPVSLHTGSFAVRGAEDRRRSRRAPYCCHSRAPVVRQLRRESDAVAASVSHECSGPKARAHSAGMQLYIPWVVVLEWAVQKRAAAKSWVRTTYTPVAGKVVR